jgi:hypothetical protein
MKHALFVILVGLLTACTTSVSYRPFMAETFPPATSVEVFTDLKPDRPYTAIGQIVVEGVGIERDMMKAAKEKAKAIGADAIIMTSDKPLTTSATYGDTRSAGGRTRYEVRQWIFLAVKWKKERP